MQATLAFRTNRDLFSNYYLDEHLPETQEWDEVAEADLREARGEILELWNREKGTAPSRNESQIEEKFIRPMFRQLGIPFEVEESTSRTQRRPDYGFFESESAARMAFERREEGGNFYEDAVAVADAKRWGRPLDTRGSGEHERDFENPSYQIHVYLQETPARWAVLTDGKKWRLYYGPTSHRLDSYYEIDLPTVLEQGDLEDFKYFYLFFRHGAFLEDASGDSFLDDVYDESNVFARELGEDLQANIYEAIKILSEGFLEHPENDLSAEDLELIHDSSLIYLYRLIFVLYAEAEGRELLDTSNEIYENSYSLNSLKQDVVEELDSADPRYRAWQNDLWSRLDELFKLIDQGSSSRGIPEADLHIPAYNGGLFRTSPDEDDSPEARFLAEHEAGDSYLARVIELLTRSRNGNGAGKIFVDYSSLDVRHLGSIYEGLLEYRLNVAEEPLALDDGAYVPADEGDEVVVEKDEVYLTTDSGERKATGSYYTPEYVVEYIVENTLGPLVTEIREDLVATSARGDERGFASEFAERVFDLKILDPAMGSGHFLTNAVDFLAREIIDAQERQAAQEGIETVEEDQDINWARRQVAQRCIYGVDLNPLATELAKVSLWLRTLAAEQPLAFLDHHLKTGNSLVGSDIETVLDNGEGDAGDAGQLTLHQSFDRTRQQALDHVTDRFQDLLAIDNETLDDVKEMEAVFESVRDDPLYQHLLAMANVHTADAFGLDVPSDAYERMAAALRDDDWATVADQDWFASAQAMAAEERFFHWELEFPVAFYGDDGERDADAGFDAVIGNPPYIRPHNIPETPKRYLWNYYHTAEKKSDIYVCFMELGHNLLRPNGFESYITSDGWLHLDSFVKIRNLLLEESNVVKIADLPSGVFKDATVDTCIFVSSRVGQRIDDNPIQVIRATDLEHARQLMEIEPYTVPQSRFRDTYKQIFDLSLTPDTIPIKETIEADAITLGDVASLDFGLKTGDDNKFVHMSRERPEDKRLLRGANVDRYSYSWEGEYVWYVPEKMKEHRRTARPGEPERFESEKLLIRDTLQRLAGTYDPHGYYVKDVLIVRSNSSFDVRFLTAILNSALMGWYYETSFPTLHVQRDELAHLPIANISTDTSKADTAERLTEQLGDLPDKILEIDGLSGISEIINSENDGTIHSILSQLAEIMVLLHEGRNDLRLNLLDYLGNYIDGQKLPDIGLYQPAGSSVLDSTSEEYEKLQILNAEIERSDESVSLLASARYKPENPDEHETDSNGYTETEFLEAFTLTDLTETEAALVEAFVPAVVAEGGGFAGFRKNAAKTISPFDRLKAIRLPDPDDVADDLRRYLAAKERADELDEKIERTDRLIDEIVYELYGLTDEEIEIVESSIEDN